MTSSGVQQASASMLAFAARTGLTGSAPPKRYLWTDAFAVCNFLALGRATGEQRYVALALDLVEQVHQVLGKHRPDSGRSGWLSGLNEQEGARHPTRSGLRIGKKLPERRADEPFDSRLEWERDGQYFHYLTKWAHALDQTARRMAEARFNRWGRELMEVAYQAFSYGPPGFRHMVWKMNTDLSRVLVASMGQHDALDGWLTCEQLTLSAAELESRGPCPRPPSEDFAAMVRDASLFTTDPLGIGGLFFDALRVRQMMPHGLFVDGELLDRLLVDALRGLDHYLGANELRQPASRRLAFRELGLVIGLQATELLENHGHGLHDAVHARLSERLAALRPYRSIALQVQAFWLAPDNQQQPTWLAHEDINQIMLVTSLVPDGLLTR